MNKLIKKIEKQPEFKNLIGLVGEKFGLMIFELWGKAKNADKELDIVHEALTELYNLDSNIPIIKKALDRIDKLK